MEFAQGHRNAAHLTEISIKNHCSHYDIALITDSSLLFAEIIAFMTIRRSSVYMCTNGKPIANAGVLGNHSFFFEWIQLFGESRCSPFLWTLNFIGEAAFWGDSLLI